MPMAGLWEAWKNPENGEWLRFCTIITTEANELGMDQGDFRSVNILKSHGR
jgi:putative SOS response-associated peptidase YedK